VYKYFHSLIESDYSDALEMKEIATNNPEQQARLGPLPASCQNLTPFYADKCIGWKVVGPAGELLVIVSELYEKANGESAK
jgi:hypothetical protein